MKKYLVKTVCCIFILLFLVVTPKAAEANNNFKDYDLALELYQSGRYRAASDKLKGLLDNYSLVDIQQISRVHMLLAASYFHLEEKKLAAQHFSDLLNFSPEIKLNPILATKQLNVFFAGVKKEKFGQPRPKIKTRKNKKKKKVVAKKRENKKTVTDLQLKTIKAKQKSDLSYFIPFGYGQFRNKEKIKGTIFLSLEAAALSTSIVSFSLYQLEKDGLGGFKDSSRAETYRNMFLASFFTFVGGALIGVVDGFYAKDQEVTKKVKRKEKRINLTMLNFGPGVKYVF